MPVEPPPTRWRMPSVERADEAGVAGVGADLAPGTLLHAYRHALFPMHVAPGLLGWWSPDPRGVIPLDGLRVSRSLRRSCRRFELHVDRDFDTVVAGCAHPDRHGAWIGDDIRSAYGELHRLGWAHSVEAWDADGLAGGLYGVAIGGLFAGESMFHRRTDASKVALVGLVDLLHDADPSDRLLDVQWVTPHLASLGAVEVSRTRYLALLDEALTRPLPPAFA